MAKEPDFVAVYPFNQVEFRVREDGIIEGFVETGVEIDGERAKEYSDFIAQLAPQKTGLLIHKKNSYSLTFQGQRVLGDIPNIVATALLAYSDVSRIASISQKPIMGNPHHAVEVFGNYEDAIDWLHQQIEKASREAPQESV